MIAGGNRRKSKNLGDREKTELNPEELKQHLRHLWLSDADVLRHLFPMLGQAAANTEHPTDVLFIDVLPVPPPRTRPCQFTGGIMTVHPQSSGLQYVIESVAVMKQVVKLIQGQDLEALSKDTQEMIRTLKGETLQMKMDSVWKELQGNVDHVLDKVGMIYFP